MSASLSEGPRRAVRRHADGSRVERWALARDLGLIVLAILSCALYYTALRTYAFEDAFITFRYADNLASGHGFVFNPGERVLGTSTPLFTLVLAFFGLLGLDIHHTGIFLSALGQAATALGGAWIARRFGYGNLGALFAVMVLWGSGELSSYFGMETGFYSALLFGAVLCAIEKRPVATGLVLGLACLTRFDGVVFAGPLFLLLLVRDRRMPWRTIAAYLSVVVPWLVFSLFYFGGLFPNTLQAKSDSVPTVLYMSASLDELGKKFLYPIWRFVEYNAIPRVLCLVLLVLLVGQLLSRTADVLRRNSLLGVLLAGPVLLWLGYSIIAPPVAHGWYLIPGLFFFVLFCLLTWGEALRGYSPWPATVGALVLVVLSVVALPFALRREAAFVSRPEYLQRAGAYERVAAFINRAKLNDLKLLTREPGYLTYVTRNPAVDAAGLVSEDIFFHGPKGRATPLNEIVRERDPKLIVLSEHGPHWKKLDDFIPVYHATGRSVFIQRDTFAQRLQDLAAAWIEVAPAQPEEDLVHELDYDFEIQGQDRWGSFEGWTGSFGFIGNVGALKLGDEIVKEDFLTTHGAVTRSQESILISPAFRIDFDEISFLFAATGGPDTAAELLVNGLPVLTIDGRGLAKDQFVEVVWPVFAWRGRTAVLRFVDRSNSGFVAADHVRSRRYADPVGIEDFESGAYSPELWVRSVGHEPMSYDEIAITHGLRFVLGRYSALGREQPKRQVMRSRPFRIERRRLAFVLFDFGGGDTSVRLIVDGEDVLRQRGHKSGDLVPVVWDTEEWLGQDAELVLTDRDAAPGGVIGIDQIIQFDPGDASSGAPPPSS